MSRNFTPPTTTPKRSNSGLRIPKPLAVTTLVVVCVVSALCLANYILSQYQLAPLSAAADQMRDDVLIPAGATKTPSYDHQEAYGLNYWFQCFDVQCPAVGRNWEVPITPGSERQFVLDALKREGWTPSMPGFDSCQPVAEGRMCGTAATKNNMRIDLDVSISRTHTSSTDVSPKVWRSVMVGITLLPPLK